MWSIIHENMAKQDILYPGGDRQFLAIFQKWATIMGGVFKLHFFAKQIQIIHIEKTANIDFQVKLVNRNGNHNAS